MSTRQSYPVGDSEYGQLVQATKSLPVHVSESTPTWTNFSSIVVSTLVVNLGISRLSNNRATITVETNPIRFTLDGSAPTASLGHLASAGDIIELQSAEEVREFQAIRQGAADATLMVTFGQVI